MTIPYISEMEILPFPVSECFLLILLPYPLTLQPLSPSGVKDFFPSHFIKSILYPPGVSVLSYMCQDFSQGCGA